MTQSKAYNLKIYCDMKHIDYKSEEAVEFLDKKFYEQLAIINGLKTKSTPDQEEVENSDYSILDRLIRK